MTNQQTINWDQNLELSEEQLEQIAGGCGGRHTSRRGRKLIAQSSSTSVDKYGNQGPTHRVSHYRRTR